MPLYLLLSSSTGTPGFAIVWSVSRRTPLSSRTAPMEMGYTTRLVLVVAATVVVSMSMMTNSCPAMSSLYAAPLVGSSVTPAPARAVR